MKLNCDLGESFGSWQMGLDEKVMPHIDMANIACGFHAGDPDIMTATLELAQKHNVEIGAHPSYHDLQGFGRRSIHHTPEQIINLMTYQVSALIGMAKAQGLTVTYVKPHGALYNDMMADDEVRTAIFKAMQNINAHRHTPLKLMLLATTETELHKRQANDFDLELIFEAFADRRYTDHGRLLSRSSEGAVLNRDEILQQVKQLIDNQTVLTDSGKVLPIAADTICVHGDNQAGVQQIKQIRQQLNGIKS